MAVQYSIKVQGVKMKLDDRKWPFRVLPSVLLIAAMILMPSRLQALDIEAYSALTVSTETAAPLYVDARGGIDHRAGGFATTWVLAFDSAGTYAAPFFGSYLGDFNVEIEQAGFSYELGGLWVSGGQTPLEDIVHSPYSLFQNASGISALGTELRYEDDTFFFRNRWIILNRNLRTTLYTSADRSIPGTDEDPAIYDDRGAVLKTWGFRRGPFRFGFQDTVVFTDDFFDFNYFALPVPTFFIQYIGKAPGRPWSRTQGDSNAVMGFFADYEDAERYAYAQILVDDINMNRFIDPSGKQNPDKIAWSLGGTMDTTYGTFGLYHAGATKYTFESARGLYYSYTMYPGSAVLWKETSTAIPVESTMLGYLHGENNLALTGTWQKQFGTIEVASSLELSLSGAKSPANPWHAFDTLAEAGEGTRLLNDTAIEKKIILGIEAAIPFRSFTFGAAARIGYIANRLALIDAAISDDGNAQPIFIPSSDSGIVAELSIYGTLKVRP